MKISDHKDRSEEAHADIAGPSAADLAEPSLKFRIGRAGAFIAPVLFAAGSIYFFVGVQVFDLTALALVGFLGLFVASWFAKSQSTFWDAVLAGVSSRTAATLYILMLMVGLLAEMLKATGVSDGFVWLAQVTNLSGGPFVMITFLITCAIALATGSSIGTMFTMFPIMYSAGVAIGAEPVLLAGAILSGAIFGDNLAPISDTTVVSATTQKYRRRSGLAEVGGVVRSRLRYSLPAAGIAAIGFLVAGSITASGDAVAVVEANVDPAGLWMLLSVAALLIVAFTARDLFLAIGVGLVVGIATALITGLTDIAGVFGVDGGAPVGFLPDGLVSMYSLIAMLVAVFGIIGVIEASGIFQMIVNAVLRSPRFRGARGSEIAMASTGFLCTISMAGLNGPGLAFAGPLTDKIGSAAGLHPYRRSNVMDCFAMVGAIMPIASSFLLIAAIGTQGYEGVPALDIFTIVSAAYYPIALGLVMAIAIFTGWGRRFEGPSGMELKAPDTTWEADMTSSVPVPELK